MTARLCHNLRAALTGALALACFVTPTAALADDPQIAAVRVGFTGAPVEERWFPLRVTINPGDEPVQAILTVDVQQDSTSRARTVTPVASAPGVVSVVNVPICMARGAREITLTLTGTRGRELHTRTLQCAAMVNEPDEMAEVLKAETPIVASLLGASGPTPAAVEAAFPQFSQFWQSGLPAGGQRTLTDTTLTPADLPDAWLAYQGANVMLVRGADALKLDARQLSALRQWVLFGGRLIIIADAPGQEWSRWLPPADTGAITLGDTTRDGEWPAALVPDSTQLFAGAQRRWITLTAQGRAAGWVLHDQHTARPDQPGLMAVGPVGFGIVTIVGFDPSVALVPGATAAIEGVWRHILSEPSGGWTWLSLGNAAMNRYVIPGSGETQSVATAMRSAMDATVVVPPVASSLVLVLGVLLFVLAILLGPGDRYILGRLGLRHRSWISGPLWIAVGGVLMLVIPDLARSTQTTVSRCETIDILCPPIEGPSASTPALALSTDLRAAFAASSMDVAWPNLPEGSFVRGISVSSRSTFGPDPVSRAGARPLTLLARSADGDGGGDPLGGFAPGPGPVGGSASCAPPPGMPTSLKRWSLRTILSQARVRPTLSAVALDTGAGMVVRITGLGAGEEIIGCAAGTGVDRGAAAPQRARGDVVEVPLPAAGSGPAGWWWQPPGENRLELLNALDAFPGLPAREGSISLRLESGRFALVRVAVRHGAPEEAMTDAAGTTHFTLYRLLVPLPAPAPKPDRAPAEVDNAETGS